MSFRSRGFFSPWEETEEWNFGEGEAGTSHVQEAEKKEGEREETDEYGIRKYLDLAFSPTNNNGFHRQKDRRSEVLRALDERFPLRERTSELEAKIRTVRWILSKSDNFLRQQFLSLSRSENWQEDLVGYEMPIESEWNMHFQNAALHLVEDLGVIDLRTLLLTLCHDVAEIAQQQHEEKKTRYETYKKKFQRQLKIFLLEGVNLGEVSLSTSSAHKNRGGIEKQVEQLIEDVWRLSEEYQVFKEDADQVRLAMREIMGHEILVEELEEDQGDLPIWEDENGKSLESPIFPQTSFRAEEAEKKKYAALALGDELDFSQAQKLIDEVAREIEKTVKLPELVGKIIRDPEIVYAHIAARLDDVKTIWPELVPEARIRRALVLKFFVEPMVRSIDNNASRKLGRIIQEALLGNEQFEQFEQVAWEFSRRLRNEHQEGVFFDEMRVHAERQFKDIAQHIYERAGFEGGVKLVDQVELEARLFRILNDQAKEGWPDLGWNGNKVQNFLSTMGQALLAPDEIYLTVNSKSLSSIVEKYVAKYPKMLKQAFQRLEHQGLITAEQSSALQSCDNPKALKEKANEFGLRRQALQVIHETSFSYFLEGSHDTTRGMMVFGDKLLSAAARFFQELEQQTHFTVLNDEEQVESVESTLPPEWTQNAAWSSYDYTLSSPSNLQATAFEHKGDPNDPKQLNVHWIHCPANPVRGKRLLNTEVQGYSLPEYLKFFWGGEEKPEKSHVVYKLGKMFPEIKAYSKQALDHFIALILQSHHSHRRLMYRN